jgi:hypothetical protein
MLSASVLLPVTTTYTYMFRAWRSAPQTHLGEVTAASENARPVLTEHGRASVLTSSPATPNRETIFIAKLQHFLPFLYFSGNDGRFSPKGDS